MFNGNRGRDERQPGSSAAGSGKRGMFSVIGADIVITGNLVATADLHVDGRIEGDVQCATLIQGAESQIFGKVSAESARLAGTVDGSVNARELTIERTARIIGDVEYETITVEQGGHVDGHLRHSSGATTAAAPALVHVSSEAAA
ncbi:bactofilin family protein [Sphingomonas sp. RS6]